jgi:hypothetical protein
MLDLADDPPRLRPARGLIVKAPAEENEDVADDSSLVAQRRPISNHKND